MKPNTPVHVYDIGQQVNYSFHIVFVITPVQANRFLRSQALPEILLQYSIV